MVMIIFYLTLKIMKILYYGVKAKLLEPINKWKETSVILNSFRPDNCFLVATVLKVNNH